MSRGSNHLPALAGDLGQPVLVNLALDVGGQAKRLPGFEALDALACGGGTRRHHLPERGQLTLAGPSQEAFTHYYSLAFR